VNDLHNSTRAVTAIVPAAIGANGTKTGVVVDRQGYGGVEFVIGYGSVTTTGSVVTVVAFEGDVTGTLTSVADTALLGTEALASLPAGNAADCRHWPRRWSSVSATSATSGTCA
jgi:hypothetical protein